MLGKVTLWLTVSLMVYLGLFLTGCDNQQTKANKTADGKTVQTLVTINYGDLGVTTSNAYLYMGVEKGIYKKHGIDLNIVKFSKGGPEALAAAASGGIDMGQFGTPILTGIYRGIPIKVVGSPAISRNEFILVGQNDIPAIESLQGKTLGVGSVGGGTSQALRFILQKHGLQESDVKVIATGATNNAVMAFQSGQLAAIITNEPWATKFELDKTGHILALASDYFGRYQHTYIFASDKLIKENPDAVKRFFEANREAIEYAKQHKEELAAFTSKELGIDEKLLLAVYDKYIPTWDSSGKVDVEGLKNAVNIVKELGDIDKNAYKSEQELMDLRLLP